MEPVQKLIYDRSLADVQRVAELNRKISAGSASAEEVQEWFSAKGALNYEDLNRIESWTEFLSNQLKSYGYNAPITKRVERVYSNTTPAKRLPEEYQEVRYCDWRVWDIPKIEEINRIRDNINSLREGFYRLSDWREIAYKDNLNIEDVNTLEWDMQTIYDWLKLMVLNFNFSGEMYAGEAW